MQATFSMEIVDIGASNPKTVNVESAWPVPVN